MAGWTTCGCPLGKTSEVIKAVSPMAKYWDTHTNGYNCLLLGGFPVRRLQPVSLAGCLPLHRPPKIHFRVDYGALAQYKLIVFIIHHARVQLYLYIPASQVVRHLLRGFSEKADKRRGAPSIRMIRISLIFKSG